MLFEMTVASIYPHTCVCR